MTYLFGLTFYERELFLQTHLPFRTYSQLARNSSSIAPVPCYPLFKKSPILSDQSPKNDSTYQPARYFTRGAIDHERKRNPLPFFYLLEETNETPQPRPIPRNRRLLRQLCRGKGVLRRNEQGHVYLDIDNQFILSLLPYLLIHGLTRPPYFNLFSSPNGAHISVISAREAHFQDIVGIQEIGQEFEFEIEGLYSVNPHSWPEIEQVWFFKVRSPDLERLRRKYFLPARPGGHPFIIATAVRPAALITSAPAPTFRISPIVRAA